jgi:MFS family permease
MAVLFLFALDLLVMAVTPSGIVVVAIIVSGALLGVGNALFTSLAMEVSPATRSVASAGYNFLRWAGAAVAPVLAGYMAEHVSPRSPFVIATATVTASLLLIWANRGRVAAGLREQHRIAD